MDERGHRIGLNEALFREVNERIERVTETLQVTSEKLGILCECGDDSCSERIDVMLADYERIRSDPELFFVCPGHEEPDVETLVEQGDGYGVVRKDKGEPARMAIELDPRDPG